LFAQEYYHSATHSRQFDVSFPEKLLKIVATRGEIFSLKFTKYRLAAGLRLDPLLELKRSPRLPSRNKEGYTSKGREGRGGRAEGNGRNGGRGEKGGKRRERRGKGKGRRESLALRPKL